MEDLTKLRKEELIALIGEYDEALNEEPSQPEAQEYGEPVVEGDNSRWELETDDVINRIEHALRRERRTPDGSKWEMIPDTDPIMNERGISTVIATLKSYLNKNNALGNIDIKDSHKITKQVCDVIVDLIKYNHNAWNLSKSYFGYVVSLLEAQVFIFLTRPVNDGERKSRQKKYQFNERYSHDEVDPSEISMPTVKM